MGNIFKIPWPWPFEEKPEDVLVNATGTNCDVLLHNKHLGEIALLSTAAFLFLLLNVVKHLVTRKSLLDVVVPVDLLNSSPFRFIYCLILTLWASDTFQDLVSYDLHYHSPDNGILDAAKYFGLTPTVIFLREALIYFPVLACVDFTLPCLGHCLGFLYTIPMACYNVYWEYLVLRGCSHRSQLTTTDVAISLIVKVPVFVGYVCVIIWFFCHAAMEAALIISTKYSIKNQMEEFSSNHYQEHVKMLFRRTKFRGPVFRLRKNIWSYAYLGFNYVLPFKTSYDCFEFPLPFLAAVTMSWTVIYQLVLQLIKKEVDIANNFIEFVDSFNITVEALSELFPARKLLIHDIFYDVQSLAQAMLIILPFGTSIGTGCLGFFTMYLVQNFHKRMKRAARGDIAFLVASEPLPSKAYILAASMKYCAFQVAYMIFCCLLYCFMEIALLSFGMMFYYLFKDFQFLGIRIWSWVMVPMIWATLLHHFELFVCRYFFLDNREGGDLIHIRHENLYKLLTFLLFFFNVIFGMILSFLRLFGLFMFSVVMYMRIDWDVYMRGMEGWDFGHRTYVGYMYLEYTRNNAVLRTFLQLLSDQLKQHANLRVPSRETTPNLGLQNISRSQSEEPEMERVHLLTNGKPTVLSTRQRSSKRCRKARNLWLVAYTLIHNPQLIELTGSSIRSSSSSSLPPVESQDEKSYL